MRRYPLRWNPPGRKPVVPFEAKPNTSEVLPLDQYDRIVVSFSGGKDSTACVLHMLELGVPKDKIVLWHNLVDGPGQTFMDWPVTESYCAAFAEALGLELRFSWREGGFEREMTRKDTPTAPVSFETDADSEDVVTAGGKGPLGTRMKFPQVSADLSVRWCSAYLKIDVARRVFSNDPAYDSGTFLLVTGERREESAARARYAEVDRHSSTNKSRRVDQWRAVIDWSEEQVWDIIARWKIRPHPAYFLGWGRVSCMLCIFGEPDQWASARQLAPDAFNRVADYEDKFGLTIHRKLSVHEQADRGKSFLSRDRSLQQLAMSSEYPVDLILVQGKWELPSGAFRRTGGPS